MKREKLLWALVVGLVAHALLSSEAWAQFKAQVQALSITSASGLSGAGTTDSPLAFTGTTTAALSTSAAAPQYACSLATATCQMNSATNDATTSSTVGAITLKATSNITATDLVLDVQDSAGAHILSVTEEGTIHATATKNLCLNGSTCTSFINNSSGTVVALSSSGVALTLQGTGPYFYPSTNGTVYLGLTVNRWADVKTVDVDASGTGAFSKATGDALTVVGGGYARITNTAGAPTGTDCDAAGEAGRIAIDTSNNRWYFCNGAAWQYTNKDVP